MLPQYKVVIDIMQQMLSFNPYFRPSALEILKNDIFEDFRNDMREDSIKHLANYQVFLPVDSDDAFDYENQVGKYSIEDLKSLLIQEINDFNKEIKGGVPNTMNRLVKWFQLLKKTIYNIKWGSIKLQLFNI